MGFIWPPTKDMGGVLTLTGAPNVEQYNYSEFSFCVPFSSAAIGHLLDAGAKVIPTSGNPGSNRWTDETNVVAYFIGDELTQGSKCSGHKCTPEEIKAFYDALKKKTNKPVGSIWVAFPPDNYYGVISQLDFAMIVCYPYKTRYDDAWALGRMSSLLSRIRDRVTVPVIIIGQAEDASDRLRPPGIEGVRIQRDFWYEAGFPICWYSWSGNGTEDIQRNFQALMREWYAGVAPPPKFPCPYCPEVFLTQAELDAHIASEHPIEEYIVIDGQKIIKPEKLIEDPDYPGKGARDYIYFYNTALKYGAEWTEGRYIIPFQSEEVWKALGLRDYHLDDYAEAMKQRLRELDPSYNFVWGIWKGKKYWIKKKSIVDQAVSQGIAFEAKPSGIVSFTSNTVTPYPTAPVSILPFPAELIYEEPEEVITTETILHTCNTTISYRLSSYSVNNHALTCPHCGLSLGIEGIKGSEEIIEEPEVITPHIVICQGCGSRLELSISSIANKNIQQFCPVCGAPAD